MAQSFKAQPFKYQRTRDASYPGGKPEQYLDVQAFARDLAPALGAEYVVPDEPEGYDSRTWARIRFPEQHLAVTIYHGYNSGGPDKVSLSLRALDVPQEVHANFYGAKYKLPSITVSTERPLPTLVRDIERRLLVAAKAPLEAQREVARQHQQHKEGLAASVAALRAEFPDLHITVSDRGTEAGFTGSGPYVSGRVYADGTVGIDRLQSMSRERFAAILRLLQGGEGA